MSSTIQDFYGQWFDTRLASRPLDRFVFPTVMIYDGEGGKSYWHTQEDRADGPASFDPVSGRVRLQGCARFPELAAGEDGAGVATLASGSAVLRRVDVYYDVTIDRQGGSYTKTCNLVHFNQDGELGGGKDRLMVGAGDSLLVRYVLRGGRFKQGDAWISWQGSRPACVETLRMGDQEVWILDHDAGRAGTFDFLLQSEDGPCDPQIVNKPVDG